jgi:hypothetical protein
MKKGIMVLIIISMMMCLNIASVDATDVTNNNNTTVTNTAPTSVSSGSITPLQNPLKASSVKGVIFLAVDLAMYIGIIFAILAIIFVGFKFVAAQGKPEKIKEAQSWFMWIVVGLAVLISSKVIVEIIKTTLVNSGVVDEKVFNQNI